MLIFCYIILIMNIKNLFFVLLKIFFGKKLEFIFGLNLVRKKLFLIIQKNYFKNFIYIKYITFNSY